MKRFALTLAVILGLEARPCLAETLYNGLVLPDPWPPRRTHFAREPQRVPYLAQPPAVIPIEVGRQLFVDDFLIESTSLTRRFHSATLHPTPVLLPDRAWELKKDKPHDAPQAFPFSDGVWYDPRDRLFKMWYMAGSDYANVTCYATSTDGLHWNKPALDVVPGTNIVITQSRNSGTVWLDHDATDPSRRFVLHRRDNATNRHVIHYSVDGIHWGEPAAKAGAAEDRSTLFYNPFRRKWVFSIRSVHVSLAETADPEFVKDPRVHMGVGDFTRVGRMRRYVEGDSLEQVTQAWPYPANPPRTVDGPFLRDLTSTPMWVGADRLDPVRPDIGTRPELYNVDAVGYESLMVGLFTIWRGVPTSQPGRDKINEVCASFSRDGFHFDRPSRAPLVGVSEDPNAWNYSNVQSVGGGCLIVGDQLYFYVSGRPSRDSTARPGVACGTGLATLRRDGFASMEASDTPGTLTTRPLRFSGGHLFVNVDCPAGVLEAEVLDESGKPFPGFTREQCVSVKVDSTRQEIRWKMAGAVELAALEAKRARIRFHLTRGRLYAFWISPDAHGASRGFTAAGGPDLNGARDLGSR